MYPRNRTIVRTIVTIFFLRMRELTAAMIQPNSAEQVSTSRGRRRQDRRNRMTPPALTRYSMQ